MFVMSRTLIFSWLFIVFNSPPKAHRETFSGSKVLPTPFMDGCSPVTLAIRDTRSYDLPFSLLFLILVLDCYCVVCIGGVLSLLIERCCYASVRQIGVGLAGCEFIL